MIVTRRSMLKAGLAVSALPFMRSASLAESVAIELKAQIAEKRLMGDDTGTAQLWTYNGLNPGPDIRCRRGDRLSIAVENALPQGTSVHWHGIRINNAMDGVSGLTQAPIDPGDSFTYDFTVPDAGTYWYHPHNRTWEQMARGLYGPLIVEEEEPYPVDSEQVLVIDDWRLNEDGSLHEQSFGSGMDLSHAGRLGNWATVNGISQPTYTFALNERVRFRLINSANARVVPLSFGSLPATLVALDGQPLDTPMSLNGKQPLMMAPAQRADVVVDMTAPGALAVPGQDRAIPIANLALNGEISSALSSTPVRALPTNNLPPPDLSSATSVNLLMQGGAMRWLESGIYNGEQSDGRALSEKGQFWSFNGQVGRTDVPLFSIETGQTVIVEMINDTGWQHAMHFHGHHFREVVAEGAGRTLGPWRDTILLEPDERKEIAFVADNPGKWMIHCHMLEHQAAGMATWFHVV